MRKTVIAALAAGILVIMGGLQAADFWSSRTETLDSAESRAANLALILSEYVAEAFSAGDAALRQLVIHSARMGGTHASDGEWAPSLASAHAGLAGIGSISITDQSGIVRHSTLRNIVGQSRADNYIVREALKSPGDALIVGNPVRAVVEPFGWVIPIARRLTLTSGVVDGAVVASFIPSELRRFFQRVNVGARGMIWVFHRDGTVLFREPSSANAIGESARTNPIFLAASAGQSAGTLRGELEAGGPQMITAFRAGAAADALILGVSVDQQEQLAHWRREVQSSGLMFGTVAALLGVTLVILFRQIDAKAAAELALVRSRELEAERLRETNEQLAATVQREQRARQEAEAASALKDQFLMTVSHELRTPLTAIAGWARLLVDGMVGDAQRDAALQTIERNAQTQTRLIEDLLDVSGIMAGKLRLDMRSVDVGEVVTSAVDAIAPAVGGKSIRLETSIDPEAGCVRGDPERMRQVVWNLLSNAVKFTPPGGRVSVAVAKLDGHVEIVVSDTGTGIPKDFVPHVFERFRQADASPSRRHGGLGLGLAIVRSLVEMHGGIRFGPQRRPRHGRNVHRAFPAPVGRRVMAPS